MEPSHAFTKVTVTTDDGKALRGIIGSKPPHVLSPEERKKTVDIKNMYIDIGVNSKEEASKPACQLAIWSHHTVNSKH